LPRQSRDTSFELPLLPRRRGMVSPSSTLPTTAGRCFPLRAVEEPTRGESVVTLTGDRDPSLTPNRLLGAHRFVRVSRDEMAATARGHRRKGPRPAEKEQGGTSNRMPMHPRRETPFTMPSDVAEILSVTLNRDRAKPAKSRGQESL
jgi:hypothetical protein